MNLRRLAQGQVCRVRLPGICNCNPETTVLAHIKNGWYGSVKPPDVCALAACSSCHDVIDGRVIPRHITRQEIDLAVFRGLCEQLCWYVEGDILKW